MPRVGGSAGRILDDGSIDLRDRNLISVVQDGELLGRLHPALPGVTGRDALGDEILPPALTEIEVVPDARVEAREEGDGIIAYHARTSGGVSSTEETRGKRGRTVTLLRLGLYAVSEIDGDVDYSTGHVDFSGDVVVRGSVKPLFRVCATGSVTVEGNAEPGSTIHAGRDIALSGGAIGERTHLQAGGSVLAKFVQQAKVQAGADVEIGSYVFETSVRAAGRIVVNGKGDGGGRALVGGLAWAGAGIETSSLGLPSNPTIRLVVGVAPEAVAEAESLRSKLRTCEARQTSVLRELHLHELDADQLRRMAEAAPASEQSKVMAQLQDIVEYGLLRRHLRERLEALAVAQREHSQGAELRVNGPVFTGAELRMGDQVTRITTDSAKLRCHLAEDEDGRVSIQAESM